MEFDKSRVFTALNANELKIGSKVLVTYNLETLKKQVETNKRAVTINRICSEGYEYRFGIVETDCLYSLAYLISEPEEKKLKWSDLKLGDVITNGNESALVTRIKKNDTIHHICAGDGWWYSDVELKDWEKVEK